MQTLAAGDPDRRVDWVKSIPFIIIHLSAVAGVALLGWSWKGNASNLSFLDIAVDWEGAQLSGWGNTLIKGTGGLSSSTTKPTSYTQ